MLSYEFSWYVQCMLDVSFQNMTVETFPFAFRLCVLISSRRPLSVGWIHQQWLYRLQSMVAVDARFSTCTRRRSTSWRMRWKSARSKRMSILSGKVCASRPQWFSSSRPFLAAPSASARLVPMTGLYHPTNTACIYHGEELSFRLTHTATVVHSAALFVALLSVAHEASEDCGVRNDADMTAKQRVYFGIFSR